jgi:hypothetical protein
VRHNIAARLLIGRKDIFFIIGLLRGRSQASPPHFTEISPEVPEAVFLAFDCAFGCRRSTHGYAIHRRLHAAAIFQIVVELKPVKLPRFLEKTDIGQMHSGAEVAQICIAGHNSKTGLLA